jgi:predicted AAA+ superfamily ATPase
VNGGGRRELFYFRDQQGLEVDFVVPARGRKLLLLEAKASRTVRPEMADGLVRLSNAVRGWTPEGVLVFRGPEAGSPTSALRPGVRALSLADTLTLIG